MKATIKLKILAAVLGIMALFGVSADSSITSVSAETLEGSDEYFEEVPEVEENDTFEPYTLVYSNEDTVVEVTFTSAKDVVLVVLKDSVAVMTVQCTYTQHDNIIDIYIATEWLESFVIQADGTLAIYDYSSAAPPDEKPEIDNSEESFEEGKETALTDEEIMVPIIGGLASIAGVALLYLTFRGKLGKLKDVFEGIAAWFKKKGEDLATEEIELKAIQGKIVDAIKSNEDIQKTLKKAQERNSEEYQEILSKVRGLTQDMANNVCEMRDVYIKRAEEVEKQYMQIKDVLIKLAAGNPTLVRSGVADELVKTLQEKEI